MPLVKNIDVILICISNPIIIGIYLNGDLIDTIKKDGKMSDILSAIFENLMQKYNINNILYTNSPGNFLSIKLAYIYLKTISITKNINIKAVDGFFFNKNKPIKGIMGKFFIKKPKCENNEERIILTSLEDYIDNANFTLVDKIDMQDFNDSIEPLYIAPAVY